MSRLTKAQRSVYDLLEYATSEGLTTREIAAVEGRPTPSVRRDLSRLYKQKYVQRVGIYPIHWVRSDGKHAEPEE